MLQALVPVERARLALRHGEAAADGSKGPSTIEVPDLAVDAVAIGDILASLTLLSGVRMSIALRLLQDKIVADDDEDEDG
jgi:hypothetical protein